MRMMMKTRNRVWVGFSYSYEFGRYHFAGVIGICSSGASMRDGVGNGDDNGSMTRRVNSD